MTASSRPPKVRCPEADISAYGTARSTIEGKPLDPDELRKTDAYWRPLELAICNQADRFSLAIDAIDRIPRFRVTGSSAREALLNQQLACKNHAHEFGVDPSEIANWQWPFKRGSVA
jgi:phosphoketolase